MENLLPLTLEYSNSIKSWAVRDAAGNRIAIVFVEENAEFFVTAANAHYDNLKKIDVMLGALEAVVANWEYQKKSGGNHFTSAPTELEWKAKSREKTQKLVQAAIAQAKE